MEISLFFIFILCGYYKLTSWKKPISESSRVFNISSNLTILSKLISSYGKG